jgi:hypothetical protein
MNEARTLVDVLFVSGHVVEILRIRCDQHECHIALQIAHVRIQKPLQKKKKIKIKKRKPKPTRALHEHFGKRCQRALFYLRS